MKKQFFSFLLALCMVVSLSIVPAFAAESDACEEAPPISAEGVSPRLIWPSSRVIRRCNTGVDGCTVDLKVYYDSRDESSNTSGYYITNVSSVEIVGRHGFKAAKSAVIEDVTYSSNHQYATVLVKFQASVGAGYADYTTQVRITSDIGEN